MRAALLVKPGEIVVDQVADPEVGPDDVRVAVGGVGLCGSDLSVFSGRWPAPSYPWIMGHEAFGTVEAVGEHVPAQRIGETVVVEPNAVCFACEQCLRGRTSACVARQSVGMNRPGALAERLVVPSRFAWRIDSGMEPRDLVCVEPLSVVQAALRRHSEPLPDAALVVGVGPQGLLMTLALLDRGVEVRVHDINPDRVAFAAELGARAAAPDDTESRFDLVVDTVGSPASTDVALARLQVGGTLLFLGLDDRPFQLSARALVRGQMVLRGSLTYDHPVDFESTVALVASGDLAPGRIVTDEHPLVDAQRAFDRNAAAPGKTWVRIGETAETY
jgi:alcohol dehydrogenase/L-iditol 2-dehydrogenase